MDDLTLIIPAKKEKESLPTVLNELKNYTKKINIILEENDTETINSISDFDCHIIYQKNKGYGDALITGINSLNSGFFCIFNADGSFNPIEIEKLYNKLKNENSDFIFASRYEKNCGSDDDTFIRAIGNKIFTFITRKLLQLDLTDSLFFYPLIRKKDYIKIQPKSTNFGICIEIPFLLSQQDLKYTDILSLERERFAGKTKVNAFIDGVKILFELIKMYLKK